MRSETILKIGKKGHYAKAILPLQNGQFGSKIKNAKNMRLKTLQAH